MQEPTTKDLNLSHDSPEMIDRFGNYKHMMDLSDSISATPPNISEVISRYEAACAAHDDALIGCLGLANASSMRLQAELQKLLQRSMEQARSAEEVERFSGALNASVQLARQIERSAALEVRCRASKRNSIVQAEKKSVFIAGALRAEDTPRDMKQEQSD